MKKIFLFLVFLIFINYSYSQKYTISGYVEDAETGERLIGANIYDANLISNGTISNVYGFYTLTLPKTKVKLTGSFVGYYSVQTEFLLNKDTIINIVLSSNIQIGEVTVTGERNVVEDVQMSIVDVPIKTIQKLPVLLGEVDVLKTLQLMPGVQSGTEGTSGIYVRGGGPDQNLILLDGVPVYNVNHLFGFFSVFNADAISDVTLIKGGFPARYGGRLSSVLDIRMKEGNMKKFHAEASVGIISSKIMVEGPIIKDKTSFIVSARRTYIDILAAPIVAYYAAREDMENFTVGYYFYDINAKLNHKFSDKDRLFFSIYSGKDKVYLKTREEWDNEYIDETEFDLFWLNFTSALRWNHVITNKLFANLTLTYSKYDFTTKIGYYSENLVDTTTEQMSAAYSSGIEDWAANLDFDFSPNPNHKIKYGANAIYHTFSPGVSTFKYNSNMLDTNINLSFGNKNIFATEFAAYFEDEIKIGSKLKINAGVHASGFDVKDTSYYSIQPRLSVRFLVNDKLSVKAAYSQMEQYLHFLTNSTIGLPTDLWLPATDKLVPQKSTQYAIGTAYELTNQINISLEGFYKQMYNLIEYKEGESFFTSIGEGEVGAGDNWEDKVESGEGWAYGIEFLIQKNLGKFSGWIGYTYSITERQFENISFGEVFPYKYGHIHDASIVMIYQINDNIDVGLTWVYGSGNAVTLAQQRYIPINQIEYLKYSHVSEYFFAQDVEYYGKRNNYRLPAYHRLDIGVNISKEKKYWYRTWSFGLYNAYSHHNTFFAQIEGYDEDRKLMSYSLFPVIPSISYKINLK